MIDNKLHLVPVLENGQTYDASFGSIVLPKAGYFAVTIKEYQEDEKKINELEKKKQAAKDFAIDNWEENEKKRWSEKKLKEQYQQDIQEYSRLETQVQNYSEKYNNVNWCWQIVGKKRNPNNLSHNESFSKGIYQIQNTGKQSVKFPEFLIGGGISWIEAFHENSGPTGQIPYGLSVQCYGVPEIARIEWTDMERNPLTEKIGFNSKVILHIYTKALYGQELEIKLTDENSLISPKNKPFSDVPVFQRQVNIKKLNKRDLGKKGVSGVLTKEGQKDDEEPEYYTQKIELEILIEEAWDMRNGSVLSIFPSIKSLETDTYFEKFEGEALDVVSYANAITSVQQLSNKAVVIGTLETNVAAFHPCQYTAITLEYEKGKETEALEIYKEDPGVSYNSNIEIGLILGSEPKKFSIKVDEDSDTHECAYKDKPKDHEKNIFTFDKLKSPKNVSITKHEPTNIEGTAYFDYSVFDNSELALKYIWPTKNLIGSKIKTLAITADTCRHHHDINITIFPDIRWELAFMFALKNPLAYTYSAGKDNEDIEDEEDKAKRDLIYADAHKKAYNSGNDRNKLRHGKEIDSEFFLTLKGKFNKVEDSYPARYENEQEYGAKFAKKVSDFLDILAKLKTIANNAKDAAGGAARNPKSRLGNAVDNDPFSFEILSPKVGGVIQWEAEQIKDGEHKGAICTTGTLKLVADPLIGAEFTVNMLAVASKINPIVYTIKKGVDIGLDALGGYMKLDLKFYGALNITIETLKINSLEGVKLTDKPAKIDGKMGIKLVFKIYAKGTIEVWGCDRIDSSFDAEANLDAYFGGTAIIKADSKGIYADIEGRFSGLLFSAKFEIKVGKYFKKVTISNEVVLPDEIYPLGVYYLT